MLYIRTCGYSCFHTCNCQAKNGYVHHNTHAVPAGTSGPESVTRPVLSLCHLLHLWTLSRMSFLPHKKTVRDHGAEGQSNLKPIMVTALRATEMALDGLPIPAAKTCISLVLKVIEVSDVCGYLPDILKHIDFTM